MISLISLHTFMILSRLFPVRTFYFLLTGISIYAKKFPIIFQILQSSISFTGFIVAIVGTVVVARGSFSPLLIFNLQEQIYK